MAAPNRTTDNVVVGITFRLEARPETPPRLIQNRAYLDALEHAGAVPLPLPLLRDPTRLRTLYDRCDALLLPGGPDVEPRRYHEEPRPDCDLTTSPDLDATELLLTRWAVEDDRPLLAICRGAQLLNVACGGSLWQDLSVQHVTDQPHDRTVERHDRARLIHPITVKPDTHLHAITGVETVEVNSLHHQGLHDLGAGLDATAWSPDGVVEALEMPGRRFVVGLQCHPEELSVAGHPWAQRLFEALVRAARA